MNKIKFHELLAMSIGIVIGSGIFALVGIGIGLTGRSVSVALLIGCIVNLILMIPFILTASVTELQGGAYDTAKLLLGKRYAAFLGIAQLLTSFILSLYCIAIANYLVDLVPAFSNYNKLVAFIVLTIFMGISYTGIKGMSKFQVATVILMIVALLVFIVYGFTHIQPNHFTSGKYFSNGFSGLLIATAVLSFASAGGQYIVNLYKVVEKPHRNIPLVGIISTIIVGVIYFAVGVVASGVLPIEVVKDETLTLVAREVLPNGAFLFFIVGGAIMALSTSANTGLAFIRYPMEAVVKDGYLPKVLIKTNEKDYPYVLMFLIYIVCAVSIFSGFDMDEVISISLGPLYTILSVLCFSVVRIPKLFPEEWKASKYYMNTTVLYIVAIISASVQLILGLLLVLSLSSRVLIGSVVLVAVTFAIILYSEKILKINSEVE